MIKRSSLTLVIISGSLIARPELRSSKSTGLAIQILERRSSDCRFQGHTFKVVEQKAKKSGLCSVWVSVQMHANEVTKERRSSGTANNEPAGILSEECKFNFYIFMIRQKNFLYFYPSKTPQKLHFGLYFPKFLRPRVLVGTQPLNR